MNVGGLSFTYGLETDDIINSSYVFNAHDASWITFVRGLFPACQQMYRNRESAGCFNTANFLKKVSDWQATRPERLWVADAQRKYLRPYEANGTVTYLPMLAGKKTHQREQVKTYNAYYYASKYVSDFCTSQNIMVRGNTPTSGTSITVVPPANTATMSMYINCYLVITSTSHNVVAKVKGTRGTTYTMDFSTIGQMTETELYFCSAPMITELSGLAHLYFKQNNFGMATNLQRLEIGSNVTGYENPNLESLTIGNSKMLEYLDARNCPNVTGALDLSGCVSLSEVYLENTAFTGISFAPSGLLTKAHLPSPTSITMRGLTYLSDLLLESADSLSTLRVEDCVFNNSAKLTVGNSIVNQTQATKDIVIALIEAATNLSRTRLIGVDWTLLDTTLLDRIYNMSGIDDDGYDVAQSIITGEAFTPTMRSGLYNKYHTRWTYLAITYTTMIAQYLATFLNADGAAIKDLNNNAYTQWVDSGDQPYDPITMGYTFEIEGEGSPTANEYAASSYNTKYYHDTVSGAIYLSNGTSWATVAYSDILKPARASTAQYVYTFSGWDNLATPMYADRNVTAQYTSAVRKYTVKWYKEEGGELLETQTDKDYGAECVFSGDIPTYTDNEANYTFRLFKDWDKSTGFITGDTNVYAIWNTITALPSSGTNMSAMSPVQIYGVAQAGLQDMMFESGDYTTIKLGHDHNYSNIEDIEIGTDVTLTGIQRDTFVSGGYYFDGSHAFVSDIQLFKEDSPAFTMVIDFQFNGTSNNETIISAHEGNTSTGFRFYYNGTAPTIQWGDQYVTVGYSTMRDIVVLRHPKGSKHLYVYSAGQNTDGLFAQSVTMTPSMRSNMPTTNEALTFGAERYGTDFRHYGKGTIHWCKIWLADLGDTIANELAIYPHEEIQMEYIDKGCYYYADSAVKSKMSFICNSELDGLFGRLMRINSTNVNSGGWAASTDARPFLNGRFLKALPYEWQAMIKPVEIISTAGDQTTNLVTTYDKVYLPSIKEVGGSSSNGYSYESDFVIPWFTSSLQRIKFRGRIRKYGTDVTVYTCGQDPAALYQTDIEPGTIWINTNNSSIGYIFVSQAELTQYGKTATIAADSDYAQGGWVIAYSWWLRSPNLSYATNFCGVNTNGYAGSNYSASNAIAVVPGFSI